MAATVVTDPARPTRVRGPGPGPPSTAPAAVSMAASMSAVAAATWACVGGSARRCRSVSRTQPMSVEMARRGPGPTAAVPLPAAGLPAAVPPDGPLAAGLPPDVLLASGLPPDAVPPDAVAPSAG